MFSTFQTINSIIRWYLLQYSFFFNFVSLSRHRLQLGMARARWELTVDGREGKEPRVRKNILQHGFVAKWGEQKRKIKETFYNTLSTRKSNKQKSTTKVYIWYPKSDIYSTYRFIDFVLFFVFEFICCVQARFASPHIYCYRVQGCIVLCYVV